MESTKRLFPDDMPSNEWEKNNAIYKDYNNKNDIFVNFVYKLIKLYVEILKIPINMKEY